MSPETQFTDPASVEAWDCWFRWRDHGVLRDLTIDATWARVAGSAASVEGPAAARWARRFIEAFRHWRVLPDARILRLAGTGARLDPLASTGAVINAAAFVRSPGTAGAAFEGKAFVANVALTVRFLDDVLLAAEEGYLCGRLRLGLIGVADALHHLGMAYDSPAARHFASRLATALAEGALQAATDLASERGADNTDRFQMARVWQARGVPPRLVDEVLRCGMRHGQLTLIEAHPHLALLANNASDALDPRMPSPSGHGRARRAGTAPVPAHAQLELRAAMQRWIDAPIDYPAVAMDEADHEQIEVLRQLARDRGLPPVALRRAGFHALADDNWHGRR